MRKILLIVLICALLFPALEINVAPGLARLAMPGR